MADEFEFENGQLFFIYNYHHNHCRMVISSKEHELVGWEQEFYTDNLWYLKAEEKHPGYYYIMNGDPKKNG